MSDAALSQESEESEKIKTIWSGGLFVDSVMKTWYEVSKINFLAPSNNMVHSRRSSFKTRGPLSTSKLAIAFASRISSYTNKDMILAEDFLAHVTSLLNEDQLWGCFYIYPELYNDVYSPRVTLRHQEDVPGLVNGLLTIDMVSLCLSYLKKNPLLGNYVYIKCDLKSKHITNIDVLQHFKYLVYLNLESNYLTELKVLSYLPYLQYLCVSYNRLETVLDYETPQWFLTEVHYKYNSIKILNDLTAFWSITTLDLSHNNIKGISGLSNLKFLRHLDLSFNHIQRLENLDNLKLTWLDVSYNNISTFENSSSSGLWTLLHLEYINLNENNFKSMKVLAGCVRLQEVYARNNRFSHLLELVIFLHPLRRLLGMDLRASPVCSMVGYKEVVLDTFPNLVHLDGRKVEPIEQRNVKMSMCPEMTSAASRALHRLLYVEQLSRAHVSPRTPPADTTEVPLVLLVGVQGVGKRDLVKRLRSECGDHVSLARLHTTADQCSDDDYHITISRKKFDDMIIAGEFLTYSEFFGESYGLSREEAEVTGGKVKLACMDLHSALMLKLRGRRPFMILVTVTDKSIIAKRQQERREYRNLEHVNRELGDQSMLQVLVSGQIIIRGILNELLSMMFTVLGVPEKSDPNFVLENECSLLLTDNEQVDDDDPKQTDQNYINMMNYVSSAHFSVMQETISKTAQHKDSSLHSLYKSEGVRDDYISVMERSDGKSKKTSDASHLDYSKCSRSVTTWKGSEGYKSSKSVTFGSQITINKKDTNTNQPTESIVFANQQENCQIEKSDSQADDNKVIRSISCKVPVFHHGKSADGSLDMDVWLSFLIENGLLQASDVISGDTTVGDNMQVSQLTPNFSLIKRFNEFTQAPQGTARLNTKRRDYESIHRNNPGLFWDTIVTDDPDKAFHKLKSVIMGIVKEQQTLTPMFNIDFVNTGCYPGVQRRMEAIRKQIAPQRLFY